MNIFKKFLAKKEEKEDLEKFLCTLTDTKPCRKISWMGFFKSFKKDLKQNRIGQVNQEYSWKDWMKDQESVETYSVRFNKLIKVLDDGKRKESFKG
jgi:hypothetical protein